MAVRARPDNLSLEEVSARPAPGDGGQWFAELWRHHQELQAVCLRMVGDPGKAEDLVQETYLRALQQSRRLDRRDSFGPWLATVARRRAIDEIRSRHRTREQPAAVDLYATPATGDDPVEQVLQQEMFDRIQVALRELSTRERQLLLRQVTHGLTLAELAEEEDTSIASVRSVLSRARGKLRSALERGGPLGVAPAPKVLAALRERLQRVAAKVEGAMPSLAAGGAQLGDMVGAVIAAAVMLLGGTVASAPPDGPLVEIAAAHAASATGATTDGTARATTPRTGGNARVDAEVSTSAGATPAPAPLPPPLNPLPPGVDPPWLPQDDASQPEGSLIEQLVVSSDGSIIYANGFSAGRDGGALYRSTDQGRSWTRITTAFFERGPLLIPDSYPAEPTLFAVTLDLQLMRSDNHGESFEPLLTLTNGIAALSPDFHEGDRQIHMTLPQAKLGRYDVETHVTRLQAGSPGRGSLGSMAFTRSHPAGHSILVGAAVDKDGGGAGSVVYRCDDTACLRSGYLPGTVMAPRLVVSNASPGTVFAVTNTAVYRSDDNGANFARLPQPAGLTMTNGIEGLDGELFVFGSNLSQLQPAASGLFRSTDGGLTWTPVGVGTPLQKGVVSLAQLPNGWLLASGTAGIRGVFCSKDNGATWTRRCA